MGTVYHYNTLNSTLHVDPAHVQGGRIRALDRSTNALVSDTGVYTFASVNKSGVVSIYAETKNWGQHMESLFQDLAELATEGELVVEEIDEACEGPRVRWVVKPGEVLWQQCQCTWGSPQPYEG